MSTRNVGRRLRSMCKRYWQRQACSARELVRVMLRRWYLVAPVLVIWAFACLRLFVDPTPRLPLLFNWTPSLPYHVAWKRLDERAPSRGDFIVYAFEGEAFQPYGEPRQLVRHGHDGQNAQSGQRTRGDERDPPSALQERYPGLRGQPFFKRVRGVPGDLVTVQGRLVLVNGEPMGLAKTHTHDRHPLTPLAPRVIPAGEFYVQGTSVDSFDSRYRESGLVKQQQILAVVYPLF